MSDYESDLRGTCEWLKPEFLPILEFETMSCRQSATP